MFYSQPLFKSLIFVDQFNGQTMVRCLPHTVPPSRVSPNVPTPPLTPTMIWLLRFSAKRRPPRQKPSLSLYFFVSINLRAKMRQHYPPVRSAPAAPSLRCTIQHLQWLSIDCCIFSAKRWPPKAKNPPPLPPLFWWVPIRRPKQVKWCWQAQAQWLANCTHWWGGSGRIICGQLCSAHGEKEGNAAWG